MKSYININSQMLTAYGQPERKICVLIFDDFPILIYGLVFLNAVVRTFVPSLKSLSREERGYDHNLMYITHDFSYMA